jgi:RHS repeat-associated protein
LLLITLFGIIIEATITRGWLQRVENPAYTYRQTLEYYKNGNVKQQVMRHSIQGWSDLTFNYTYDPMNRLTQASCSGCSQHSETYQYDNDGNIERLIRGTSKDYVYSYYTGRNRLQTVNNNAGGGSMNFYYNGKGAVTSVYDNITPVLKYFTYDYRNMPVQVTYEWENIDTYHYYYDENGMRVRREKVGTSSGREYYLRDHTGREVAIYDYNSNRIKMINLFGHGLEGKVNVDWQYVCIPSGCSPDGCEWTWQRTDSKYYYVKDHLGNIRVTLQQNGNLASARDYYPYGETLRAYTTAGVGDRYQLTEKERDAETNLDYFGARYYDGGIIRWLTPDPLADKYYGWSPYNYTLGNPLRYIDPDGREVVSQDSLRLGEIATGLNRHLREKHGEEAGIYVASRIVQPGAIGRFFGAKEKTEYYLAIDVSSQFDWSVHNVTNALYDVIVSTEARFDIMFSDVYDGYAKRMGSNLLLDWGGGKTDPNHRTFWGSIINRPGATVWLHPGGRNDEPLYAVFAHEVLGHGHPNFPQTKPGDEYFNIGDSHGGYRWTIGRYKINLFRK